MADDGWHPGLPALCPLLACRRAIERITTLRRERFGADGAAACGLPWSSVLCAVAGIVDRVTAVQRAGDDLGLLASCHVNDGTAAVPARCGVTPSFWMAWQLAFAPLQAPSADMDRGGLIAIPVLIQRLAFAELVTTIWTLHALPIANCLVSFQSFIGNRARGKPSLAPRMLSSAICQEAQIGHLSLGRSSSRVDLKPLRPVLKMNGLGRFSTPSQTRLSAISSSSSGSFVVPWAPSLDASRTCSGRFSLE